MTIENNKWLDTKQAAEYLKMSPQTLENLRSKDGAGPKYYKPLERKVLYLKNDLDVWVTEKGEM